MRTLLTFAPVGLFLLALGSVWVPRLLERRRRRRTGPSADPVVQQWFAALADAHAHDPQRLTGWSRWSDSERWSIAEDVAQAKTAWPELERLLRRRPKLRIAWDAEPEVSKRALAVDIVRAPRLLRRSMTRSALRWIDRRHQRTAS